MIMMAPPWITVLGQALWRPTAAFFKILKKIFFNIYSSLRQRETEHQRGRGRERGRHSIRSRLQALSHQPRTRRAAQTHRPRDRDPELKSDAQPTEPPRRPWLFLISVPFFFSFFPCDLMTFLMLCLDSVLFIFCVCCRLLVCGCCEVHI